MTPLIRLVLPESKIALLVGENRLVISTFCSINQKSQVLTAYATRQIDYFDPIFDP